MPDCLKLFMMLEAELALGNQVLMVKTETKTETLKKFETKVPQGDRDSETLCDRDQDKTSRSKKLLERKLFRI